MSMERRALLAFVASMLLFLAYDALYLSPRMKKQQEARRAQVEEQPALADSIVAAEPPSATEKETFPAVSESVFDTAPEAVFDLPQAADVVSTTVTVVSDLYEFTLTNAGGEIVSARLLAYATNGEPVELYGPDPDWTGGGVLNLALQGEGAGVALSNVGFEAYDGTSTTPLPDRSRLVVDARRGYSDLVFRARTADGRAVERSYRFYADRYDFEASVRFARAAFPTVLAVAWGFGPGMSSTEANVADDQQNFKASIQLGEEFHRLKPGDFSVGETEAYAGTLSWAALQTKYFLTAIVPSEPTRAEVTVFGDKTRHRVSQTITLPVGTSQGDVGQAVRVYMGPLDYKALEPINAGLDKTIEMGWRWIRPVSWIVLKSMMWMYRIIPNYGWVIIIISLLTKVLFYRLTHKSFKSMKEMQDLQPRLAAIKEKYKDDRQRVSQETMKLYKEAGVNPLGGCLPMLLQMPVFVALFNVLKFTIEVRGAHFVGWINDLSQQDVLFLLPVSIPFIGDAFSLLPILMGASMFMQSKLGGSPTGGASMAQPPGMQTMLPIVFTVLFYKMPSGLVLYWIINTVMSVAQQYYIHKDSGKSKEKEKDTPAAPVRMRRAKKER